MGLGTKKSNKSAKAEFYALSGLWTHYECVLRQLSRSCALRAQHAVESISLGRLVGRRGRRGQSVRPKLSRARQQKEHGTKVQAVECGGLGEDRDVGDERSIRASQVARTVLEPLAVDDLNTEVSELESRGLRRTRYSVRPVD